MVVEPYQEFTHLDRATSRVFVVVTLFGVNIIVLVLDFLAVFEPVLVSDLILDDLGARILGSACQLSHEANWLVKQVRRSSQGVLGETSLTLPEPFSNLKAGVDALTTEDLHGVDVQKEQVVRGQ